MSDPNNNIPQRDFIYTCPSKVFNDQSLTLNELKIYMMIRSFMDTTGSAYPTNNWIAEKLGINKRNTISNINKLIEKGYLERIEKNGKRFLTIKLSMGVQEGVSQKTRGDVVKDTGGDVAKDTLLYQSNITSKSINKRSCASDAAHQLFNDCFQEFWDVYPVKKNKLRAQKLWAKKNLQEIYVQLIEDVNKRLKLDSQWQDRNYIPHASTYLHNELWNDDIIAHNQTPIKSKGNASDALSRVLKKHMNGGTTYDHTTGNTFDSLR